MPKSELVDLTMTLHAETDKAIRVSDDGFDTHAMWLPKSQVEFEYKDRARKIVEVTMPDWLAIREGLV